MWENIEIDRHYTGVFNIFDDQISGELIYNKKNGVQLYNSITYQYHKSRFNLRLTRSATQNARFRAFFLVFPSCYLQKNML